MWLTPFAQDELYSTLPARTVTWPAWPHCPIAQNGAHAPAATCRTRGKNTVTASAAQLEVAWHPHACAAVTAHSDNLRARVNGSVRAWVGACSMRGAGGRADLAPKSLTRRRYLRGVAVQRRSVDPLPSDSPTTRHGRGQHTAREDRRPVSDSRSAHAA